jgi:cellulose synthase (UDP-forming)
MQSSSSAAPSRGGWPCSLPYFGVALTYLIWRSTVIAWDVWYGPLVYIAELYNLVCTGLFVVIAREIHDPVFRPTALKKTVDVFIATYTEPLDVLEPVVIGAMRIRGRRNVLVLDDGNRPEVAEMAQRHGAIWIPRTTNEHAKAGNLNHGLQHSDAEFILELDADHVPLPWFIERTLGYFDDPDLAFVQTPQTFYNRDTFLFRHNAAASSFWFEQRMFYDAIQPAKNKWNSAFFVGTSALLRRSALDSIGGFATETATEDIHTAARLHARGWKSVFVSEVLAYGLEAENYKEFFKQRRRWAAGSLGLLMRSPDSPLVARRYSLGQRLNYLYSTLAHFQGAQKLFLFILPIVCLVTLQSPFTSSTFESVLFFTVYIAVSVLATAVYARGTYHLLHTEAYNMASLPAHVAGLKGIVVIQKKFTVSRKSKVKKEPAWSLRLLWLMTAVATVAVGRSVWLMMQGDVSGIVMAAFIFTFANLICLVSFLGHLRRYERLPESLPQATTPRDFYYWILRLHEELRREPESLQGNPKPVAAGALAAFAFLLSPDANAEGLALGGFDLSKDGNSAYVGTIVPVAGGTVGRGPAVRLWADYNTYSYNSSGEIIDAKATGLEVALAYQVSSGENWGSISVGPRYSYTRLSPADPANKESGAQWGVKLQAGGEVVVSPEFVANAFAAYTTGTEAYWARVRLLYRFGSGLRTGPEVIAHGNTVYNAGQVGWVVTGIKLTPSTEVGLKGGARRTKGESTHPYGGVEFVSLF